jgi:cytochrome P450
MLGIPSSDRELILRLTQQNFGSEDPEYRASLGPRDDAASTMQFAQYFMEVAASRRQEPTDDISSVLAHATVDGEPLAPRELLGMFGILATAGHDTTSSAIAGGLLALLEHPDQIDRLRDDPALVTPAVEEMIRWVTPVKSFMRTAAADTEIRGQRVQAGDAFLLVYPSANRDEDVFDQPDVFDVGRTPNRHVAFGHGIHFCLGAQLARLEARAFFRELIPRLKGAELAGPPDQMKTLFVGGLKHMPIRASVA